LSASEEDYRSGSSLLAHPWLGGAALVFATWVQLRVHDRSVIPMDEGHLASAAHWILGGASLYVDIHTGIFPGIYALTALLFAVAGEDLLLTRYVQLVVNLATGIVLWRVALRCVRPHWAALAPLLHAGILAMAFPVLAMFNYSPLATAFGLGALLAALRHLERGRVADGVAMGLLLAASALTKQNFGGLVFVAVWIAWGMGLRGSPLAERGALRAAAPVLAAGAALTAAMAAWIVAQGAAAAWLDSTLLALGGSQLSDFDNPIPPVLGPHPADDPRFNFLYLPPAVFNYMLKGETLLGLRFGAGVREASIRLSYGIALGALLLAPLVWWRARDLADPRRRHALRAAVLFAVVFFPGIFPSAVWSHLAFVAVPLLLLLVAIGDGVESGLARVAPAARRAWLALAGAVALLCVATTARITADVRAWYPVPSTTPRATLRLSPLQQEQLAGAVAFVQRCARPGERIFVAPEIPVVYFLTGRESPTKYDLTIPGDVDGPAIVAALERQGIRCVVFNPRMYPEFPDFEELFPRLAAYLQAGFRVESRFSKDEGSWLGLVRRRVD